jgi:FKBP-type peptidyl-prolyl cis-trans isomerase
MSDALSLEANAAFLAANGAQPGVTTTASGLQIRTMTPGDGKKPGARQTVTVHYEGKLIDGSVFDSSYKRGETISFRLDQVIPGWTEGLQLMAEGETAELVIPQDIGYGARGSGRSIPPYQTLIFKVELQKVS